MKRITTWIAGSLLLFGGPVFLAAAQALVALPTATEWAAPAAAPAAPGDGFAVNFPAQAVAVLPQAPVVAEWNRTAKPDESLTLTGARFTLRSGADLGSDTRVLVYAQTAAGGVLREAKVWQVTPQMLVVSLPDDVPFGMYLLWVENEQGASAPVAVNRPVAEWVGPLGNTAAPGETKRVFGKNLSANHGEQTASVYVQAASGGGFTSCAVTSVEPYAVGFTVPASLAAGSYVVRVHSGHGGSYGWSNPLPLTVAPAWQRGAAQRTVSPSGADDTPALQSAVDALTASPNGGTLRLGAGTYRLGNDLVLKANVRVLGAGKAQTTLLGTGGQIKLSNAGGARIALEELSLLPAPAEELSIYSMSFGGGDFNTNLLIRNVDMKVNTDDESFARLSVQVAGIEVTGCVLDGVLMGDMTDVWVHGNTLHGGRGEEDGAISFRSDRSLADRGRIVLENNAASTPAWPSQGGNRNYSEYLTANNWADWRKLVWCTRLVHFALHNGSLEHSYIAHNTTRDVATDGPDGNKGEQILFHEASTSAYCQVAANAGRTLTIRTDGRIDGSPFVLYNGGTFNPITAVPNAIDYGSTIDNTAYVLIVGGTGLGQANKVVAHTATTLTVADPWRLPPDNTSRIFIMNAYARHIQYKNTLEAFPVGYVNKGHRASLGVNYDGNSLFCAGEGNVTRRTFYSESIAGHQRAPSYWCELRDDEAYQPFATGLNISARGGDWGRNPTVLSMLGPLCLGNWLRGGKSDLSVGTSDIVEGWGNVPAPAPLVVGSGVEGLHVLQGSVDASSLANALYRNNRQTDTPYLGQYTATQFVNNGSAGFDQSSGNALAAVPVPVYRTARFNASNLAAQLSIPVANAGVRGMTWSVAANQPWIVATVAPGTAAVPAENVGGRLLVSLNPAALPAGRQTGLVTLTTANNQTVKVGVFVDPAGAAPLPVALMRFEAQREAGQPQVALRWATATERNNQGFEVQRRDEGDGAFRGVGFVSGAGSSAAPRPYAYADPNRFGGRSYYRLRQLDADGTAQYSPVRAVDGLSGAGSLHAVPNPAHTAALLTWEGPPAAGLRIILYSADGRQVWAADGPAGKAPLTLPVAALAPGAYWLRYQAAAGLRGTLPLLVEH